MSENLKLGQIITGPQEWDAIHIAVVPVVAAVSMQPGTRCGIDPTGKATPCITKSAYVGIVDPFLQEAVPTGARFWLFLEPGSITSLRHDWTHSAFPAPTASTAPEGSRSERWWLRDFAEEVGVSYRVLMEDAADYIKYGSYHTLNYDTPDIVWRQREEFWRHYEAVSGTSVPEDKKDSTFFTCSC